MLFLRIFRVLRKQELKNPGRLPGIFFTGNLLERKLSSEDSKQRFDVLLLLEEAFYQLLLCRRISPEK